MQPFEIKLNALSAGKNEFHWHADGSFFAGFENTEILDADLELDVTAINADDSVKVSCLIDGNVTVTCDRCLEDLTLEVHTSFEEDETLDLSQDIYDYVCLSLPMQRVHSEGGCNEETTKYLSK